ncbi:MAG: Coenzyme F420 hydrogenase/dehydrogenase, beta subunit C-terminal domain [Lentisphaeria bacterium]|nr:Coenzyme F420 hydrogenase/dehydrogenase, beta subunit C-terminal domain [Lentisphaeria bacterium]
MLEIRDKKMCSGCSACASVCPEKCISLTSDAEGFLYPQTDHSRCIKCRQCLSVCPFTNPYKETNPLRSFAAKHLNSEIQKKSSSGGVFSALAERIFAAGGVVAGVRWSKDFMSAMFDIAENMEDASSFVGSKYLQAGMEDIYQRCRSYLADGRKVLFTGTPCQVAGLKHFLNREYKNLLTAELICHGAPSPLIWKKYIEKLRSDCKFTELISVNFRDKTEGQRSYHLCVKGNSNKKDFQSFSQRFYDNLYMKAFLQDLSLRPSCYDCAAKKRRSGADLTIGDFWGISKYYPELDDDKGISLVIANNIEALNFLQTLETVSLHQVCYEHGLVGNCMIEESVAEPPNRGSFWRMVRQNQNISTVLWFMTRPSLKQCFHDTVVKFLSVCGLLNLARRLRRG